MKNRREWMVSALAAAAMALEMEQRPGVLAPLNDAVKGLELALAIDLAPSERPQGLAALAVTDPHRSE